MTDYALSKGIIPSLDGFRAAAILIVFAGHAGLHPSIPGGLGVTVFFFLSGFLITTLLIREYDRYGSLSFLAFFARRVVRLAPPLLVTLFAGAVLVWVDMADGNLDAKTILSQIFFYYNYYAIYGAGDGNVTGFAILWSLSVEEHFYLVWPFAFLVIARFGFDIRLILSMLVIILAWRFFRHFVWLDDEWVIYSLTDTRFDSLLYGCLLAVLQRRELAKRLFPEKGGMQWLMLGGAVLLLLLTLFWRDPAFRSTLRYTLQGIALMPLFHYAVMRPDFILFRPLNWGWVRWMGMMSYTFYICHFVIIAALTKVGLFDANYPVFLATSAGLSVVWAAAVFYGIEAPLKPLRSRLTGHATAQSTASRVN